MEGRWETGTEINGIYNNLSNWTDANNNIVSKKMILIREVIFLKDDAGGDEISFLSYPKR